LRPEVQQLLHVHGLLPCFVRGLNCAALLFEAFAIEVLQACRNVKAAAILGLSWESLQTIMTRALEQGLEPREASRGGQHAASFANAAAKQAPNAELAHDKFHVVKYLGEAVDPVRRADNKARRPAERHTPTLALQQVAPLFEVAPQIRSHPLQRTEKRPSLGNQGGVPLVLAACVFHECRAVLQTVVRMGSKVPLPACGQGRQDAQAAPTESSELLPLSNHDCVQRGIQHRDSGPEVRDSRLPLIP
jgi:hypothetical protein